MGGAVQLLSRMGFLVTTRGMGLRRLVLSMMMARFETAAVVVDLRRLVAWGRGNLPEDQANPKVLAEIARSTGVKIGEPLIADGTAKVAHTFETMLAHNVRAIVAALAPAPVK